MLKNPHTKRNRQMSNGNGQSRLALPGQPMPMQVEMPPINLMNDVQLVAMVAGQVVLSLGDTRSRVECAADIVAESVVLVNSGGLNARIKQRAEQHNAEMAQKAKTQQPAE